jgi:protein gp37
MGANTNIEWCDHTFNPWEGCTKVSPGCAHCYAETRNARWHGGTAPNWGKGAPRRRTSVANWAKPRAWNREEGAKIVGHAEFVANRRPRVFCASLADWLDDEVPVGWREDLLNLIRATSQLDWLLLTKRPEQWRQRIEEVIEFSAIPDEDDTTTTTSDWCLDWLNGKAPANVWIGTTVEDQQRADERIPALLQIPARVRFLSCEPLLAPVNLCNVNDDGTGCDDVLRGLAFCDGRNEPAETGRKLDWVIVGGESGPGARPFVLEHAWDIVMQCERAGVACFVKQLGAQPITTNANLYDWPDDTTLEQHGTEFAGARVILRDRKGGDIAEWPEQFQVQQFPQNTAISNGVSDSQRQDGAK